MSRSRSPAAMTLAALLFAGVIGCARPPVAVVPAEEAAARPAGDPAPAEGIKPAAAAERKADEAPPDESFRFPGDRGGQLLAGLLRPAGPGEFRADPKQPRPLPPSANLTDLSAPLPPSPALPPRLRLDKSRRPQRPAPPPEELPLAGLLARPTQALPAGQRIRAASPDMDQPVPLPILARPAIDRAPLDDPTGDASIAAALATTPPLRAAPAPFLRLGVPDPFEHGNTVRLRQPPEDDQSPPVLPTRTPAKP